ncbi:MAG: glycosyltransferase [Deltaproteobacteria bacterium]|nr:glycosyltransferase [Deltaproteobacteria bacterium]
MYNLLVGILLGFYVITAAALFLYGTNCYVMIYLCLKSKKKADKEEQDVLDRFWRPEHDIDWPMVTTQLPIYNERNVVGRLIEAVCRIDYPRDRHEIQVLDDSTDDTAELVAGLVAEKKAQGFDISHLRRTNRRGYKAGALAEGMEKAKGEYLAVFDADFVPNRDFLKKTVPFLAKDEHCGFVQTRWGHRNRWFSPLTLAQSIGIDGHFAVEQSARSWNGLFLNFNGTAGLWRRKAIEEAGGWQSDTLTEDLDLSYRTQLAGWNPRFLFNVVTPAEIPIDINAFKSQQHRWAKGSIQTAIKILPEVFRREDISLFKKVQAFLHLTHYMIHPMMLIMTVLVLPLLYLARTWFSPVIMVPLLGFMVLSLIAPNALYIFSQKMAYKDGWIKAVLFLPALMALGVGLAVNNSRAVLEALLDKPSEFVRTPKLGELAEKTGKAGSKKKKGTGRNYSLPLSKGFLLEIFMGLWSFIAFLKYLFLTKFIIGPLLLLYSVGFTSVGVISLLHSLRARKIGG